MSYKVSVITVSLNADKTIADTIDSVISQTYHNIEYIVIDGGSVDKTYEIVCSYDELFEKQPIEYIHISESDNGIYDAMNKGIKMAKGEWIIFMNSDDRFANNMVLENVFKHEYDKNIGCIYGNTIIRFEEIFVYKKALSMDYIFYKVPFYHQSLFVKTCVIKKYLFDTVYKLAADYDQYIRMYNDKIEFMMIDETISIYNFGGYSHNNCIDYKIEREKILKKYNLDNKNKLKKNVRNCLSIVIRKSRFATRLCLKFMNAMMSKREG